jgi:hypothetical protein
MCRGEIKIILATPIVRRLLVLLQRMEYGPRSCRLVRRMVNRGARRCMRDVEDGCQAVEAEQRLARDPLLL